MVEAADALELIIPMEYLHRQGVPRSPIHWDRQAIAGRVQNILSTTSFKYDAENNADSFNQGWRGAYD